MYAVITITKVGYQLTYAQRVDESVNLLKLNRRHDVIVSSVHICKTKKHADEVCAIRNRIARDEGHLLED